MGFFTRKKGSIISDYFKTINDLGSYKSGDAVEVALYKDQLVISSPIIKKEISLNYNQITDVFYGLQTDIVEKNKSVIARALTGGLLFGGVGAVVGAVSGIGTKEKKEKHFYFIISYTANDGTDKFLHFEDTRLYRGSKVAKQLKEFCGIKEPEVQKKIEL